MWDARSGTPMPALSPDAQVVIAGQPSSLSQVRRLEIATTMSIDGDTAEARTQCHNPMTMGDADEPDLMMCGLWYVDKLVRTPNGWRIKERVEEKVYMRIFPGKKS